MQKSPWWTKYQNLKDRNWLGEATESFKTFFCFDTNFDLNNIAWTCHLSWLLSWCLFKFHPEASAFSLSSPSPAQPCVQLGSSLIATPFTQLLQSWVLYPAACLHVLGYVLKSFFSQKVGCFLSPCSGAQKA